MTHNDFRSWSLFRLSATCLITLTALLVFGEGIFATPQPTQSQSDEERNTLIYVSNESGGITEINSAGNVVFGTAPWAHGSNGGIAITPDGSTMYVSNTDVSSVSVLTLPQTCPSQR